MLELLLVYFPLSATIGALIGILRGHPGFGALMGFLFGPLGWLLAATTDSRIKCPDCKEPIQREARICPHCRASICWEGPNKPYVARDWSQAETKSDPEEERRYRRVMFGDQQEKDFDSIVDEALR